MVKLCLPWKKPGKTPGFHHLPFPRGWFTTVLPTLLLYGLELSTILKYTEMKWFKTFFFRMSSIIISTVMVISWWLNGFWNVAWNFPQFWNPSRNHPFTKKGHFSIHLSMLDNIPFGGWSCWSSPSGHQLISVDLSWSPSLRLQSNPSTSYPSHRLSRASTTDDHSRSWCPQDWDFLTRKFVDDLVNSCHIWVFHIVSASWD